MQEISGGARRPDWRLDVLLGAVTLLFWLLGWLVGFKAGPVTDVRVAIVTGVYFYFWSAMFLISYYRSDASWLLKGLMWLCERTSKPRGRRTAQLWSAFAFVMGSICIYQGLKLS
ncbi:MAG: hypothetical protein HYX75_01065 [Acidobacteria bacterium]|nr:hypothetical protein [Acidobacteriota bacterium]